MKRRIRESTRRALARRLATSRPLRCKAHFRGRTCQGNLKICARPLKGLRVWSPKWAEIGASAGKRPRFRPVSKSRKRRRIAGLHPCRAENSPESSPRRDRRRPWIALLLSNRTHAQRSGTTAAQTDFSLPRTPRQPGVVCFCPGLFVFVPCVRGGAGGPVEAAP